MSDKKWLQVELDKVLWKRIWMVAFNQDDSVSGVVRQVLEREFGGNPPMQELNEPSKRVEQLKDGGK